MRFSVYTTIGLCCAARPGDNILSLSVSNGAHVGGSIQNVSTWRDIMETSGMPGWSKYMMSYRFFDDHPTEPMRSWYKKAQADNEAEAILSGLGVLVGTDLTPRLAEIKIPVLIMHPDSSPFISASVMADMHDKLPDSELQIFAHAKHGLPFSHAQECARVYRAFLDRRRR